MDKKEIEKCLPRNIHLQDWPTIYNTFFYYYNNFFSPFFLQIYYNKLLFIIHHIKIYIL